MSGVGWDRWFGWDLDLVLDWEGGDMYASGADGVGESLWSADL